MNSPSKAKLKPSGLEIKLLAPTSPLWIEKVLTHFDDFLLQHSACERKASATGINFVVQYPDRPELIDFMIRLAREELLHFQQVCRIILKRGLKLLPDTKDPYIALLTSEIRHGSEARFLDRLLVFGIAEARGCERFQLVAHAVTDLELKIFYQNLHESEERHRDAYMEMARIYFSDEVIRERLDQLLHIEAKIIRELPIRVAVH